MVAYLVTLLPFTKRVESKLFAFTRHCFLFSRPKNMVANINLHSTSMWRWLTNIQWVENFLQFCDKSNNSCVVHLFPFFELCFWIISQFSKNWSSPCQNQIWISSSWHLNIVLKAVSTLQPQQSMQKLIKSHPSKIWKQIGKGEDALFAVKN